MPYCMLLADYILLMGESLKDIGTVENRARSEGTKNKYMYNFGEKNEELMGQGLKNEDGG